MNKPTYAMSQVGACSRTLSAIRLGQLPAEQLAPPEYLRLAAREGKRHEQFIREDLEREYGWKSVARGMDTTCSRCGREGFHVELELSCALLVGHLDDFVYPAGDPVSVHIGEFKALGKTTSTELLDKGLDASRVYRYQASCYQLATNLPLLYVVKSRDTGRMSLKEYIEPEVSRSQIEAHLERIEAAVAGGFLVPCDIQSGDMAKYSCTKLCRQLEGDMPPAPILDSVAKFRRAQVLAKLAETMMADARSELAGHLTSGGRSSLELDGLSVVRVKEGTTVRYEVPEEVRNQYKVIVPRPSYLRIKDSYEEVADWNLSPG